MRKLALCASLLVLPVLAQAPAEPALYRNDALHFTYHYPAGFEPSPQLAQVLQQSLAAGATDPDHPGDAKCMSAPMASGIGLTGSADTPEIGLAVLFRFDHACLGSPGIPEDLGAAAQTLMQILKAWGKLQTEDAISYKVDGHDAAFVQGSVPTARYGRDRILHAASTCVLVSNNTVCFLLVDSNYKRMPAIIANPIVFDGHIPTPLIPADRAQPW